MISLYNSLKHRKTAQTDATELTNTVIGKLLPLVHQASLSKETIRESVRTVLTNFDKAAAVHYTAYHQL